MKYSADNSEGESQSSDRKGEKGNLTVSEEEEVKAWYHCKLLLLSLRWVRSMSVQEYPTMKLAEVIFAAESDAWMSLVKREKGGHAGA